MRAVNIAMLLLLKLFTCSGNSPVDIRFRAGRLTDPTRKIGEFHPIESRDDEGLACARAASGFACPGFFCFEQTPKLSLARRPAKSRGAPPIASSNRPARIWDGIDGDEWKVDRGRVQ